MSTTRAVITVYDEDDDPIVKIVKDYDGYPDAVLPELKYFSKYLVADTDSETPPPPGLYVDGMNDLAARIVTYLKARHVDGVYLVAYGTGVCCANYYYEVRFNGFDNPPLSGLDKIFLRREREVLAARRKKRDQQKRR